MQLCNRFLIDKDRNPETFKLTVVAFYLRYPEQP